MAKSKPHAGGNPAWKKGVSGNPKGRPKIVEEFRARARKAVDAMVIEAWIDEMKVKKRTINTISGPVAIDQRGPEWVRCSELLAAYGYGKPTQGIEVSGPEGEPVRSEFNLASLTVAQVAALRTLLATLQHDRQDSKGV